MSFQEKRTIFSVISGWIITFLYALYVYETYPDQMWITPVDFSFWGKIFIILIPVSIGARIIVHIVFHIVYKITTDEEDMDITDERDKLFGLLNGNDCLTAYTYFVRQLLLCHFIMMKAQCSNGII